MTKNFAQIGFVALGCLAAIVGTTNTAFAIDDDTKLSIGSKAPDIDIEHWVSDGDGKFEHITKLESGKVYVIEFWATWCGPCVASMPHLSETQAKYADKGVQIISVSDEDLETVNEFLEKKVRGEDEKTYAELTSNYCLTADPDGTVYEDYFRAAGQNGIPCCFIVGKTGEIEWIGHPMSMDKTLAQVVEGKWDRAAYLVEFKAEQEKAEKMEKLQRKLMTAMNSIEKQIADGDAEEAVEAIDKLIADEEFDVAKPTLQMLRAETLILHIGGEQGAAALRTFVEENKEDATALNQIAWGIYEKHAQEGKVDESILKAAVEAAEAAAKTEPENGAILDTLAHLVYETGDLDRAIEIQEKAVKHADSQIDQIQPFLDELKAEKAKQDK